ncbi:hemagluttinin family protein [Planoprotostelium fungivorum]|uniref:Hemagluttinin family protein n=1 Tax=Planoprotostelium fungivorum TaxID=1890364 RepID=A0A2P6NTV2_9EUKA|nr:hemagluttinin family protein [Planoprotostelium fungivorum]
MKMQEALVLLLLGLSFVCGQQPYTKFTDATSWISAINGVPAGTSSAVIVLTTTDKYTSGSAVTLQSGTTWTFVASASTIPSIYGVNFTASNNSLYFSGITLNSTFISGSNTNASFQSCIIAGSSSATQSLLSFANGAFLSITNSQFTNNIFNNTVATIASPIQLLNMASVSIASSIFSGNTVPSGPGAIYAIGSNVALTSCTFGSNYGNNISAVSFLSAGGGAISISGSSLVATSSTFQYNSANGVGGAIYSTNGATTLLNNCTFTGNNVAQSGGAVYSDSSSLSVGYSTFQSNAAAVSGGSIYSSGGNSNVYLAKNQILNNSAPNGGGMSVASYPNTTILSSLFDGNQANNEGGGLLYNATGGLLMITGTTVSNNKASSGAGLSYKNGASANLNGVTATSNVATVNGGALSIAGPSATISGGTFTSNSAQQGAAVYQAAGSSSASGTTFTSNIASSQGTSFFLAGGSALLSGITVQSTPGSLSAVGANGGSILSVVGSNFDSNTVNLASVNGLGNFNLNTSTISSSGSTVVSNNCNVNLNSCTFASASNVTTNGGSLIIANNPKFNLKIDTTNSIATIGGPFGGLSGTAAGSAGSLTLSNVTTTDVQSNLYFNGLGSLALSNSGLSSQGFTGSVTTITINSVSLGSNTLPTTYNLNSSNTLSMNSVTLNPGTNMNSGMALSFGGTGAAATATVSGVSIVYSGPTFVTPSINIYNFGTGSMSSVYSPNGPVQLSMTGATGATTGSISNVTYGGSSPSSVSLGGYPTSSIYTLTAQSGAPVNVNLFNATTGVFRDSSISGGSVTATSTSTELVSGITSSGNLQLNMTNVPNATLASSSIAGTASVFSTTSTVNILPSFVTSTGVKSTYTNSIVYIGGQNTIQEPTNLINSTIIFQQTQFNSQVKLTVDSTSSAIFNGVSATNQNIIVNGPGATTFNGGVLAGNTFSITGGQSAAFNSVNLTSGAIVLRSVNSANLNNVVTGSTTLDASSVGSLTCLNGSLTNWNWTLASVGLLNVTNSKLTSGAMNTLTSNNVSIYSITGTTFGFTTPTSSFAINADTGVNAIFSGNTLSGVSTNSASLSWTNYTSVTMNGDFFGAVTTNLVVSKVGGLSMNNVNLGSATTSISSVTGTVDLKNVVSNSGSLSVTNAGGLTMTGDTLTNTPLTLSGVTTGTITGSTFTSPVVISNSATTIGSSSFNGANLIVNGGSITVNGGGASPNFNVNSGISINGATASINNVIFSSGSTITSTGSNTTLNNIATNPTAYIDQVSIVSSNGGSLTLSNENWPKSPIISVVGVSSTSISSSTITDLNLDATNVGSVTVSSSTLNVQSGSTLNLDNVSNLNMTTVAINYNNAGSSINIVGSSNGGTAVISGVTVNNGLSNAANLKLSNYNGLTVNNADFGASSAGIVLTNVTSSTISGSKLGSNVTLVFSNDPSVVISATSSTGGTMTSTNSNVTIIGGSLILSSATVTSGALNALNANVTANSIQSNSASLSFSGSTLSGAALLLTNSSTASFTNSNVNEASISASGSVLNLSNSNTSAIAIGATAGSSVTVIGSALGASSSIAGDNAAGITVSGSSATDLSISGTANTLNVAQSTLTSKSTGSSIAVTTSTAVVSGVQVVVSGSSGLSLSLTGSSAGSTATVGPISYSGASPVSQTIAVSSFSNATVTGVQQGSQIVNLVGSSDGNLIVSSSGLTSVATTETSVMVNNVTSQLVNVNGGSSSLVSGSTIGTIVVNGNGSPTIRNVIVNGAAGPAISISNSNNTSVDSVQFTPNSGNSIALTNSNTTSVTQLTFNGASGAVTVTNSGSTSVGGVSVPNGSAIINLSGVTSGSLSNVTGQGANGITVTNSGIVTASNLNLVGSTMILENNSALAISSSNLANTTLSGSAGSLSISNSTVGFTSNSTWAFSSTAFTSTGNTYVPTCTACIAPIMINLNNGSAAQLDSSILQSGGSTVVFIINANNSSVALSNTNFPVGPQLNMNNASGNLANVNTNNASIVVIGSSSLIVSNTNLVGGTVTVGNGTSLNWNNVTAFGTPIVLTGTSGSISDISLSGSPSKLDLISSAGLVVSGVTLQNTTGTITVVGGSTSLSNVNIMPTVSPITVTNGANVSISNISISGQPANLNIANTANFTISGATFTNTTIHVTNSTLVTLDQVNTSGSSTITATNSGTVSITNGQASGPTPSTANVVFLNITTSNIKGNTFDANTTAYISITNFTLATISQNTFNNGATVVLVGGGSTDVTQNVLPADKELAVSGAVIFSVTGAVDPLLDPYFRENADTLSAFNAIFPQSNLIFRNVSHIGFLNCTFTNPNGTTITVTKGSNIGIKTSSFAGPVFINVTDAYVDLSSTTFASTLLVKGANSIDNTFKNITTPLGANVTFVNSASFSASSWTANGQTILGLSNVPTVALQGLTLPSGSHLVYNTNNSATGNNNNWSVTGSTVDANINGPSTFALSGSNWTNSVGNFQGSNTTFAITSPLLNPSSSIRVTGAASAAVQSANLNSATITLTGVTGLASVDGLTTTGGNSIVSVNGGSSFSQNGGTLGASNTVISVSNVPINTVSNVNINGPTNMSFAGSIGVSLANVNSQSNLTMTVNGGAVNMTTVAFNGPTNVALSNGNSFLFNGISFGNTNGGIQVTNTTTLQVNGMTVNNSPAPIMLTGVSSSSLSGLTVTGTTTLSVTNGQSLNGDNWNVTSGNVTLSLNNVGSSKLLGGSISGSTVTVNGGPIELNSMVSSTSTLNLNGNSTLANVVLSNGSALVSGNNVNWNSGTISSSSVTVTSSTLSLGSLSISSSVINLTGGAILLANDTFTSAAITLAGSSVTLLNATVASSNLSVVSPSITGTGVTFSQVNSTLSGSTINMKDVIMSGNSSTLLSNANSGVTLQNLLIGTGGATLVAKNDLYLNIQGGYYSGPATFSVTSVSNTTLSGITSNGLLLSSDSIVNLNNGTLYGSTVLSSTGSNAITVSNTNTVGSLTLAPATSGSTVINGGQFVGGSSLNIDGGQTATFSGVLLSSGTGSQVTLSNQASVTLNAVNVQGSGAVLSFSNTNSLAVSGGNWVGSNNSLVLQNIPSVQLSGVQLGGASVVTQGTTPGLSLTQSDVTAAVSITTGAAQGFVTLDSINVSPSVQMNVSTNVLKLNNVNGGGVLSVYDAVSSVANGTLSASVKYFGTNVVTINATISSPLLTFNDASSLSLSGSFVGSTALRYNSVSTVTLNNVGGNGNVTALYNGVDGVSFSNVNVTGAWNLVDNNSGHIVFHNVTFASPFPSSLRWNNVLDVTATLLGLGGQTSINFSNTAFTLINGLTVNGGSLNIVNVTQNTISAVSGGVSGVFYGSITNSVYTSLTGVYLSGAGGAAFTINGVPTVNVNNVSMSTTSATNALYVSVNGATSGLTSSNLNFVGGANGLNIIGSPVVSLSYVSSTSSSASPVIGVTGAASVNLTSVQVSQGTASKGNAVDIRTLSGDITVTNCAFNGNNQNVLSIDTVPPNCTATIWNNNFINNKGRAVSITSTGEISYISLTSNTFTQNAASGSGGSLNVVAARTDSLVLSNNVFTSNSATFGGAVSVQGDVLSASFTNTNAAKNSATRNGGAISFTSGTIYQLTVNNASFSSNTARQLGGAISFDASAGLALFNLSGVSFTSNTATSGGAVSLAPDLQTLNVVGSTFTSNVAAGYGGGLYGQLYGADSVNLNDVTFNTNKAYEGGGLYLDGFLSNAALSGVKASGNTASNSGGAMSMNAFIDNIFTFYNATISSNSAKFQGGALLFGGSGLNNISMSNVTMTGNSAVYGGALAVTGAGNHMLFSSSSFGSNSATTQGGAMYFAQESLYMINLIYVTLTSNTALIGGGIYTANVMSSFNMTGVQALSNTARSNGGVLYVEQPIAQATFSGGRYVGNTAGSGGAISFGAGFVAQQENGTTLFTDAQFSSNIASETGGGGAISISQMTASTVFSNCTFTANVAGQGGSLYLGSSSTNSTIELYNTKLWSNQGSKSSSQGGALYLLASGGIINLLVDGTDVRNNTAYSGGAFFIQGDMGVSIAVTNSTLTSNTAVTSGGVFDLAGSAQEVRFEQVTATGNTASSGGLLILESGGSLGQLTLINSTITGHRATSYNGGIFAMSGPLGNFVAKQTRFEKNSAGSLGGVLYTTISSNYSESVSMTECSFSHNSAGNGGCIYLDGGVGSYKLQSFTDVNSTWIGNKATGTGGALFIGSTVGSIELSSSQYNANTANQGAVLYLGSASNLNVVNSTFGGNAAVQSGGAIATTAKSKFVSNGNQFSNNTAGAWGGALMILVASNKRSFAPDPNALSLITNTNFTDNSGNIGGAVYVSNPHSADSTVPNAQILGVNFARNKAVYGGGIAIYGDIALDLLKFKGDTASQGGAFAVMTPGNVMVGDIELGGSSVWLNNGASVSISNASSTSTSAFTAGITCPSGSPTVNVDGSVECPTDSSINAPGDNRSTKTANNNNVIIGVVVGAVAIIAIAVVVALILIKRRKQQQGFTAELSTHVWKFDAHKNVIINFDDLADMQQIGRGAFGIVYKAIWRAVPVAVKQLINQNNMTQEQIQDFISEVTLLQGLRPHPNVVLFMGVTPPPGPISLVTEFCEGGSLYGYLRDVPDIPYETKRKFVVGIAQGMLHLASENIVHRDLAARNILLTGSLEAKVTDFGLSRATESAETGAQTTSAVGPLKWMSPEAILERRYSEKSDVYSFAMTLWEITTQKELYADRDPVKAAIEVTNGLRPAVTSDMNESFVRLMTASWAELPENRPNFRQICAYLQMEGQGPQVQMNALNTEQSTADFETNYRSITMRPESVHNLKAQLQEELAEDEPSANQYQNHSNNYGSLFG